MKNRRWKKRMAMIVTGILLILLLGITLVLARGGIFQKVNYLEPWQKSYSDKFDDPRVKLVAHGLLSANGHNMQPWKIKLDTDNTTFYLFADSERLVKEVDPYARQTMITQGTFLEYIRVAGENLGYKTEFTLFPNGEYDEQNLKKSMKTKPVARVTLSKEKSQSSKLYKYIFLPDTNREAYKDQKLTSEDIKQLMAINTDSELTLKIFQDKENKKKLGNYATIGAKIESGIQRISDESAEIFRANESEKNKYRYGFSLEGQGITGLKKFFMQGLITLFPSMNNEKSSADIFIKSTQAAVRNTPAYAMIISNSNTRTEQIKSGMLYSRLILKAHELGYVMQPPSQVLEEYPEMSEQYKQIHKDYAPSEGTIQMFIRIGKPTKEASKTMRRDVKEIIIR